MKSGTHPVWHVCVVGAKCVGELDVWQDAFHSVGLAYRQCLYPRSPPMLTQTCSWREFCPKTFMGDLLFLVPPPEELHRLEHAIVSWDQGGMVVDS